MALCTVDYVRSKIKTLQTDEILQDIINETGDDILEMCQTTLETDPNVILAGKYAILAATLTYLKTTGELAANIKAGNTQRQNTTDIDIERYEKKSQKYIDKYMELATSTYSSYSCHTGFDHRHGGHCGFD